MYDSKKITHGLTLLTLLALLSLIPLRFCDDVLPVRNVFLCVVPGGRADIVIANICACSRLEID